MDASKNFRLEIISPERKVVDCDAKYMSAPGSEGEFGVLPGHTEFFTTLAPGEVVFEDDKGKHFLAVSWGYAEVTQDSVVILAENAEPAEELDSERARRDLEFWEKQLAGLTTGDAKYHLYESKVARAKARMDVISHLQKK